MATKKAKKRARRKPPGDGGLYEFHGAFKSKAAAATRARKKGGFFERRATKASGDRRYVVMVKKDGTVPFLKSQRMGVAWVISSGPCTSCISHVRFMARNTT